jgi:hypothetical protein
MQVKLRKAGIKMIGLCSVDKIKIVTRRMGICLYLKFKTKAMRLAWQFTALLIMAVLICIGCRREFRDKGQNENSGIEAQVYDSIMITASVFGVVVNENNIPLQGATVKSGTQTTITDLYGSFRFSNISLSKANGTVSVEQNGYFKAYRTFPSTAGRTHTVRIQLLPKTNAGNFAGASGGTINIAGGGRLVVPASAVTDASGTAYNGTVNVAMTWIDPTAANLGSIIMGDLRGITTTGVERGLSTYGMLGVELTGPGGQPLKLATNKTAELTFPIPPSLSSSAPATIDLWHFNEATARWKQEGTATKTGNSYIANVSHFSFWNCDEPFPLVDLCMTLVTGSQNSPLNNVEVRIKRTVNNSYGYGRTDSAGRLCGKVPKNEALVLEVLDQCNTVAFSQNIGPFSSNSDLGTIAITLPSTNLLVVTGTITNCAGTNVINGAAVVYVAGGNVYSAQVTNGTFSVNIVRCSTGTLAFSVLGIDNSTMHHSAALSGSGNTGTVNVGNLQACDTSSTWFIEALVDGVPSNFISSVDTLLSTWDWGRRYVSARRFGGTQPGILSYIFFSYNEPIAPGTVPLVHCLLEPNANTSQYVITTPSPMVNITSLGPPVTGHIEGNFSIQMTIYGISRTVSCNFRVSRRQ